MNTYHNGRFEWFVVAIVIAILTLVALSRYWFMAEDARILRMQILAHRFVTAAANARIEFLVSDSVSKGDPAQRYLTIANRAVYFSAQAWPVAVSGPVIDGFSLQEEDCAQLWVLLMQNPAALSRTSQPDNNAEYQLYTGDLVCRFELVNGTAFFDYYPIDGRMLFVAGGESN